MMGTIKAPSALWSGGGTDESPSAAVGPTGCGDPVSGPSIFSSLALFTAPTDVSIADGDPMVERAEADPIGRLGRVALPPVCASGDGLHVMPSSAFSSSVLDRAFGFSAHTGGYQ